MTSGRAHAAAAVRVAMATRFWRQEYRRARCAAPRGLLSRRARPTRERHRWNLRLSDPNQGASDRPSSSPTRSEVAYARAPHEPRDAAVHGETKVDSLIGATTDFPFLAAREGIK